MKFVPHGYLTDLLPPEGVDVRADTVAECINGVCKLTGALDPDPVRGRHVLRVEDFEEYYSLFTPTNAEVIHVYPVMTGAGGGGGSGGGWLQVAVGAAIVAASFVVPGSGAVLGMAFNSTMMMVGASVALGGAASLLAPQPEGPDSDGDSGSKESFITNGKNTTVKAGTRIPVIYGRHRFSGHYLSMNTNAIDINSSGDSVEREVTVLPVAHASLSVDRSRKDAVHVSWNLPSDEEIRDIRGTDAAGRQFQPFPDGRDNISDIRIETKEKVVTGRDRHEDELITSTSTSEVGTFDKDKNYVGFDHPSAYRVTYKVRIEYDTGDVSESKTAGTVSNSVPFQYQSHQGPRNGSRHGGDEF